MSEGCERIPGGAPAGGDLPGVIPPGRPGPLKAPAPPDDVATVMGRAGTTDDRTDHAGHRSTPWDRLAVAAAATSVGAGVLGIAHDGGIGHLDRTQTLSWVVAIGAAAGTFVAGRLATLATRTAESHRHAVADALSDRIVLHVQGTTVVAVHGDATRLLGIGPDHLVGRPVQVALPLAETQGIARVLHEATVTPGAAVTLRNIELHGADGQRRWFDAGAFDHRSDPLVGAIVLVLADRTDRKDLEDRLALQSSHDDATGLATRVRFLHAVDTSIRRARRTQDHLAVLCVEVDDLPRLTDAHGAAIADRVLAEIAQRLRTTMRTEDSLARIGATEFGVLLPDLAPNVGRGFAVDVADRIASVLQAPIVFDDTIVEPAITVGLAHRAPGVTEPSAMDLVAHAHTNARAVRHNAGQWHDVDLLP